MQKLKLDLDVLQVTTFHTGAAEAVRGTVAANEQGTTTTTPIGTTSLLTPTLLPSPEEQVKLGVA